MHREGTTFVLEMFLEISVLDFTDCGLNLAFGRHGLAAQNLPGGYPDATFPNLKRGNKPCCNYLVIGVSVTRCAKHFSTNNRFRHNRDTDTRYTDTRFHSRAFIPCGASGEAERPNGERGLTVGVKL